jgi:hypothetical protein
MLTGDEIFGILRQYSEEVIKPFFKIDFSRYGYSQSGSSDQFSGDGQLPNRFISYKDTDYYYKGSNEKFIHFTSLNTFFEIVNNGYFLASQFTNHDNPLELLYAGKEMLNVTTREKLSQLKELIFSLSMCVYEEDTDSFDMWRLYGNNGYGIGIVFSFYPNKDFWNDSFLSLVW